jgi:hypothetical protein
MPSESEFNEVNLTNSFLPQILGIKQILAAPCHAITPILSDLTDFIRA